MFLGWRIQAKMPKSSSAQKNPISIFGPIFKLEYLSSPEPEHTTGGSGLRGARRGGGAQWGRTKRSADGSGGVEYVEGRSRSSNRSSSWKIGLKMEPQQTRRGLVGGSE